MQPVTDEAYGVQHKQSDSATVSYRIKSGYVLWLSKILCFLSRYLILTVLRLKADTAADVSICLEVEKWNFTKACVLHYVCGELAAGACEGYSGDCGGSREG